jgi:polyhydroxyalkanoate synthesis regulator phasin
MNVDLLLIEMLSSDNEYANQIAAKAKTYKDLYDKKHIDSEEYKEFMNDIVAEVKISKAVMELETKEKLNSMLTALISVATLAA